jgi:hypothetical protein
LRFLVDAQLPPALARRIEALGHVAKHVADCRLATAADSAIRKHAASTRAVIITKDEDFAVHRLLPGAPHLAIQAENRRFTLTSAVHSFRDGIAVGSSDCKRIQGFEFRRASLRIAAGATIKILRRAVEASRQTSGQFGGHYAPAQSMDDGVQ